MITDEIMNTEKSFDLIMEDNMSFVEGCYRIDGGDWHVFMFRKNRGIEKVGIKKDITWNSGVTLTIHQFPR